MENWKLGEFYVFEAEVKLPNYGQEVAGVGRTPTGPTTCLSQEGPETSLVGQCCSLIKPCFYSQNFSALLLIQCCALQLLITITFTFFDNSKIAQ